jgi:hypothetical protein
MIKIYPFMEYRDRSYIFTLLVSISRLYVEFISVWITGDSTVKNRLHIHFFQHGRKGRATIRRHVLGTDLQRFTEGSITKQGCHCHLSLKILAHTCTHKLAPPVQ